MAIAIKLTLYVHISIAAECVFFDITTGKDLNFFLILLFMVFILDLIFFIKSTIKIVCKLAMM